MRYTEIFKLYKRPDYNDYYNLDTANIVYLSDFDRKFYNKLSEFINKLVTINKEIKNTYIDFQSGTSYILHSGILNQFNKQLVEYSAEALKKHKIIKKVRSVSKANTIVVSNGYNLDAIAIVKPYFLLTINVDSLSSALIRNNSDIQISLADINNSISFVNYLAKYKTIQLTFDTFLFDNDDFENNGILTLKEIENSDLLTSHESEINTFHNLYLHDNVELTVEKIYLDESNNFIDFPAEEFINLFEVICNFYNLQGSKVDFMNWLENNQTSIIDFAYQSLNPVHLPIITIQNLHTLIYNNKFESNSDIIPIDDVNKILNISESDPLFKYKILSFKDSPRNILYYYALKIIGYLSTAFYDSNYQAQIKSYYPNLYKVLNLEHESIKSFCITEYIAVEETGAIKTTTDFYVHFLSQTDLQSGLTDYTGKLDEFINSTETFIQYLSRLYNFTKEDITKHIALVERIVNAMHIYYLLNKTNTHKKEFFDKLPILINYVYPAELKAKLYSYETVTEMRIMETKLIPQTHYYGSVIKRSES